MAEYPTAPSPFDDVSSSNYSFTVYCNVDDSKPIALIHTDVSEKISEKFVISTSDVHLDKIIYNHGDIKSTLFISLVNFRTQKSIQDIEKSLQVCLVDNATSVQEVHDVSCRDYYK
jgi:hypothetical protein